MKMPTGALTMTLWMHIDAVDYMQIKSFAEYMREGVQISLIGAIDFTYSNGGASNPCSLHYTGTSQLNQYEIALDAVGSVLAQYDSDKKYPFFGFGAVPAGEKNVNHCFQLDPNVEELNGIADVLRAYRDTVPFIRMAGPTCFAPVFRKAIDLIETKRHDKMYYILFILTDGEIHDMPETIECIVEISKKNLPLSVIVVGIGNEDFSNMVRLDGDDIAIASGATDILQFVKFNEV